MWRFVEVLRNVQYCSSDWRIEVVADVTFGGEVDVSVPITIGNIPHKKTFQTFDNKDGDLHHLTDWASKYPSLPGYTGEKYISYKSV